MQGKIYISGIIGEDTTLLDVIKQVKNQKDAESFLVKIDSVGGYVNVGNDIYNYLKNLSFPITTYTTKAYSIASVIYMAGDTRIIPEGVDDAIMIHLPWMEATGDYSTINDYLKELKSTEDELVDFYSNSLEVDKTTIHSLLKSETFLNATQALELGIATQLQAQQKALALLQQNNKEKDESLMTKLNTKIDNIFKMLSGKSAIKAELILQDATGIEIVFPDLESTETPESGALATVDNKPAEGEFFMPDGSTIIIEKGVVSEVKPIEEADDFTESEPIAADETVVVESDDKDEIISDLQAKIDELQAKINELLSTNQAENLLDALQLSIDKTNELDSKYQALAKQIGSDFSTEKKENKPSIKGHNDNLSRAAQILKS